MNTAFVILDVEAGQAEAYAIARQAVDSLAVTAVRADGEALIEARDARARSNSLSVAVTRETDSTSRIVASMQYRLDNRFSHLPVTFRHRAGQVARARDISLRTIPQATAPAGIESCSVESPSKLEEVESPSRLEEVILPELIGGIPGLHARLRYPEVARRNGVEGTVMVQFVVDVDGSVSCAAVVSGLPGGLNEAALESIMASRFTPATYHGEPVALNLMLPVRFRLR